MYCLIALFFISGASTYAMNQKYQESTATIDQKQCPTSPLNTDAVMQSLFSLAQLEEHKTSYEFKRPEKPSDKRISASPDSSNTHGTVAQKAPIQELNVRDYGVCNYPTCKVVVHTSYAKAHLQAHFKCDPSYTGKNKIFYYSPINNNCVRKHVIKHEIKIEPALTENKNNE